MFPDREHFGRIFYNQANLSAAGIAQIAVVMGSSHGRRRVRAGDERRDGDRQGNRDVFIGGPPLVKAATGEDVSAEDLGGADVHTRMSGRRGPLRRRRRARAGDRARILRQRAGARPRRRRGRSRPSARAAVRPGELYGLVPADLRTAFDVRDVIARIVDGASSTSSRRATATTLVTGFARDHGATRWGSSRTTGSCSASASLKGAHFIELCAKRRIPLVFLQNITGFMVGREYENRGLARDGAKMVMAVANARVPKLTVVVGGSFGAGNYGMAGRAFSPRQLWMWPNARISVMGGRQAASVLLQVRQDALAREGRSTDRGGAGGVHGADARDVRAPGHALLLDGAPVGRRDHRPGRHPAGARAGARGRRAQRADPGDVLRRLPDVAGGEVFSSVLVANRGEIALRVMRTCARLGIRTIAVCSDADARRRTRSPRTRWCGSGPGPAAESYLRVDRLLDAARATGAEAIHPGYGFLAESASFAEAVVGAGLAWIGPPPAAMRALGDKARAKALADRQRCPRVSGLPR